MQRIDALSRRQFLESGALVVASLALPREMNALVREETGRLTIRPKKPTKQITPGEHVLADDNGRRAILQVPATYDPKKPAPLLVAFHGAGGSGDAMMRNQRGPAATHGVVVLTPSSRASTWDAIRGRFSADLEQLDRLLGEVFDRCAIDPARLAIGGFSDGATYALSVGLVNGDVFTHIVAHSPGFIVPAARHGKPKVFVSHGTQDQILPIDRCGRRIVAQLTREGYAPRYDEFEGGHVATPEMRTTAMAWLAGTP
jgi:phospholipase/carboxylesterase